MSSRIHDYIWTFANQGTLPSDSDQERLRKALLTLIASGIAILAVFWGALYAVAGYPRSGAIPLTYAATSILTISFYLRTKKFEFFRFSQLALIVVLPFLLQTSLGGFANGSVVMVWAFFAPLAAMFFSDNRSAFGWLLAFLALTVLSAVLEVTILDNAPTMSKSLNTIFFVLNMGFGFALIYVVLHYFVRDREQSHAVALKAREEAIASKSALEQAYKRLQDNEVKIRELMLTDPLTGLPNRRHLDQRLEEEVKRVRRFGHSVCIVMTDLDYFKAVNDTFGHAVGDATLQMFSHILQDSVRTVDFVARYGGEEFVLLLPETMMDGATQVAERIRQSTAEKVIPTTDRKLSASFGVTKVRGDETIYDAIGRADKALYKSKEQGRNRVTCVS